MNQTRAEKRITRLRFKIQQERWNEAITHLKTNDGIEESHVYNNGDLPIHFTLGLKTMTKAAIKDKAIGDNVETEAYSVATAPLSLIQALTNAFPNSLRLPGRDGMLPLHIAAHSHAPIDILLTLIRHYPKALSVKDAHGRYPKDYNPTNGDDIRHRDDDGDGDSDGGGGNDHECKNCLDRPAICYDTSNAVGLRRREEKFCHVLPKFELLKDRQKKVDRQAVRCEEGIGVLLEQMQVEMDAAEGHAGVCMEELKGVQDEVDEFLERMNGRMEELEKGLEERDRDQSTWEKEESIIRIDWFMQLKMINEEMENLRNETEECKRLIFRERLVCQNLGLSVLPSEEEKV